MVFSSLDAARDTYRLGHRFRMPTPSGSKDAVAVAGDVGDRLVSTYSFLLEHIVLLVWWIALIIALFISAWVYNIEHANSELYIQIWYKRSTPFRIVRLAYERFLHPRYIPKQDAKNNSNKDGKSDSTQSAKEDSKKDAKSNSTQNVKDESKEGANNDSKPGGKNESKPDLKDDSKPDPKNDSKQDPKSGPKPSRWFILLWLLIGISFVVIDYFVPIYFAHFIKIGNAAPVSASAIYVPSAPAVVNPPTVDSNSASLQRFELFIPSAVRAAGSVDAVDESFKGDSPVTLSQTEIPGVDSNGEVSMRFDYGYNITGFDFGLQNYSDLTLNVEGSCVTEYSWWVDSTTQDPNLAGAFVDEYNIFGVPQQVSKYDGGPPTAQFFIDKPDNPNTTNITWAALISSVNRSSFSVGTDPWYRTGHSPIAEAHPDNAYLAPNMVLPKRPVLSCWENDVWSYRGYNAALNNMGDIIPGLDLSPGIQIIFEDFLLYPMIATLGNYLRQSALKSSSTSLADIFDAGASSIYTDLQRLILASYIASVNVLTESTLFPSNSSSIIPNDLTKDTGTLYPATDDFVVFSSDVVTLSVRALIIIPVVTVALWLLLTFLTLLPLTVRLISSFPKTKGVQDEENKGEDDERDGAEGENGEVEKPKRVLTDAGGKLKEGLTEQVSDIGDEAQDQAGGVIESFLSGGNNP